MFILLLLLGAALPLAKPVEIRSVETTPTQAVLVLEVADPINCRITISADEDFARPVFDTDEKLFPGSRDCARAGSVVEGNRITFVAGLRRAQKASDGRLYSRALQAYRKYYFEVRSGGEVKLGSFETRNIPLGKLYGEPFPFDRAAPGNYAWPTMDWNGQSEYIDPLTGVLVRKISRPQQSFPELLKPPARQVNYSGSAREPLFIPAPALCPDGWGCERAARWDYPYRSVDDVEVSLKASCGSAGCVENANGERDVEVCLTVDGVSCATGWKKMTLPVSPAAEAVVYPPAFPAPLFAGWLEDGSKAPPSRADMATYSGKVNTNGREVRWASGHTFPPGAWTAGSRITIGEAEYVIERVNGATSLTLASDAGEQNGAAYSAGNFGLLLRKRVASADLVQVESAAFRYATSHEFEMTASGAWDFCSPTEVSDPSGKNGYMCRIQTAAGYPTLWFVAPSDGEARYLGAVAPPYNFAVASGGEIDGSEGACLRGFEISRSDPNEVYCITRSNVKPDQGLLIVRGRYHPEGLPGCAQPAGYQAVETGQSCHFSWELATRPSRRETVLEKAKGFDPSFDPERYPYIGLFAVHGSALGFYAWAGQDSMAWSIWLDGRTMEVVSMQNYHANAPCRFCAVHSFLQLGDEKYNAVILKDFVGGTGTNAGPYEVKVTAVAGSSNGSAGVSQFQPCPADLAQPFKDAGAAGVRCLTVTLSGDPCDLSPSEWEKTRRPACPWQSGGITLQPIQEGDEAKNGTERFLFVKKLSNNQWVLMRNYNIPHGPTMKEDTSRAQNHAAGWKLTMVCSAATDSGYAWVDVTGDRNGTAMLRDNALARAHHGDISRLGSVMAAYDSTRDRFGRFIWRSAIPGRASTAADTGLLLGTTFAGINVHGSDVFRGYIQTHPSWRQIVAPEGEQHWYLDGNPFAPQAGSVYSLWNQNAEQVEGTLYRLKGLPAPLARKYLPTVAWSGRFLMEDVSGPRARVTGGAADNWKYCVADLAGECVEGSAAGEVFVNAPAMTLDGKCGNHFFHHRPCFTSMVSGGIGINQVGTRAAGAVHPERFLTAHFQRYNVTWTYSNAAPLPDGSWALTGGTLLDGARSEILLLKLPPWPQPDGVDRGNYVPVPVTIGGVSGATGVRVRFGYAENGPPDQYYCTSRREGCASGGEPFRWLSEAGEAVSCANGCNVELPGISGRVVYYVVDWLNGQGQVVRSGGRGAVAVP